MSDTYNPELPTSEYYRRLTVAVWEFLSDWRKGDFELPALAQYDAQAMEDAIENLDMSISQHGGRGAEGRVD
jgi:hypothetical protein